MWTSPNHIQSLLSIMPNYFSIGEHRCFTIDFPKDLILGEGFIPVAHPEIRRLTSKQPKALANYLQTSKQLFKHHKIK